MSEINYLGPDLSLKKASLVLGGERSVVELRNDLVRGPLQIPGIFFGEDEGPGNRVTYKLAPFTCLKALFFARAAKVGISPSNASAAFDARLLKICMLTMKYKKNEDPCEVPAWSVIDRALRKEIPREFRPSAPGYFSKSWAIPFDSRGNCKPLELRAFNTHDDQEREKIIGELTKGDLPPVIINITEIADKVDRGLRELAE